jgi:hypothetical protein
VASRCHLSWRLLSDAFLSDKVIDLTSFCEDCSGFVELTQWLPLKRQLWSLLCNAMVVFINQTSLAGNLNFWCGNHCPQNVVVSTCLF